MAFQIVIDTSDLQIFTEAEYRRLMDLMSKYMRQEYERQIMARVRRQIPVRTGRLRNSMRVYRGRGAEALLEARVHFTGAFVPVGGAGGVDRRIKQLEKRLLGRITQQAFDRAFREVFR